LLLSLLCGKIASLNSLFMKLLQGEMMSAFEMGIKTGREYLYRIGPERSTIAEMGGIARTCAKQYYKTQAKQQEFVQGWHAVIQQFQTLFKDYPTKLHIMGVMFRCEHCQTLFEVEYDDPIDIAEISTLKQKPCPICHDTGKVREQ
jgi:uncharacterized membrane protein YebE (DUF533 family)